MRGVLTWVGWAAITAVAAAAGGIASRNAPGFYATLDRPPWAPPAWLFGPAWAVLYLLMATGAWMVSRSDASGRGPALVLYLVQLAANAAWTWLFFAARKGSWAFAEVLLLLTLVALTTAAFGRVRPLAGVLLLPYLGWVTFATALTWSVWRRNPTLL